jgi:hypothetical protein
MADSLKPYGTFLSLSSRSVRLFYPCVSPQTWQCSAGLADPLPGGPACRGSGRLRRLAEKGGAQWPRPGVGSPADKEVGPAAPTGRGPFLISCGRWRGSIHDPECARNGLGRTISLGTDRSRPMQPLRADSRNLDVSRRAVARSGA